MSLHPASLRTLLRPILRPGALLVLALVLGACAGILGIRPKHGVGEPFEHRAHLLKGIACTNCHKGVMTSVDDGTSHLPSSDTCKSCHTKPHDTRECSTCHGSPRLRAELALAKEHLRFDHKKHVAASNGACIRCHARAGDSPSQALLPPMAACFGCHHHENQFELRTCDGCHIDLPKESIRPESHVVHDGDFLREHGVRAASSRDLCTTCHTERSCAACHGVTAPGLPARLAFDRTDGPGLHRAGFMSRHALEAKSQPGLCTSCHTENSCQECHTRQRTSSGSGRNPHPPGWILAGKGGGDHGLAARMDPVSCASCHGGAGEQLCIGCHRVGGPGGNPHGPGFSSTKDKRTDVPCRSCHSLTP